jgi:hypothetical protein
VVDEVETLDDGRTLWELQQDLAEMGDGDDSIPEEARGSGGGGGGGCFVFAARQVRNGRR